MAAHKNAEEPRQVVFNWMSTYYTIDFPADGEQYEVRNRIALCRCGQSDNKPYCDGPHQVFQWSCFSRFHCITATQSDIVASASRHMADFRDEFL
ncbi:MAG: CDGSH iron-sulfur domain-containing protein [Propionibacteriaceae bacterium]|nr:CDGSH iron-sulfur domain-containing protein [Propionibacteriaceae bacterium]